MKFKVTAVERQIFAQTEPKLQRIVMQPVLPPDHAAGHPPAAQLVLNTACSEQCKGLVEGAEFELVPARVRIPIAPSEQIEHVTIAVPMRHGARRAAAAKRRK